MAQTLRFLWNGIKGSDGKLQRAHYSNGALLHHPAGTLTIYAKDYAPLSAEVRAAFTVENDSELISDYIVQDVIRVEPTHPLYVPVLAAYEKMKQHNEAKYAKAA